MLGRYVPRDSTLHRAPAAAKLVAMLALVTKGDLQAAIFRTTDLDETFEKVRAIVPDRPKPPPSHRLAVSAARSMRPRARSVVTGDGRLAGSSIERPRAS